MMDALRHAALTHPGRVRKQNEDNWFADAGQGLYLVSDGMGGVAGGALAARLVVEALPPLIRGDMRGLDDLSAPAATSRLLQALAALSDRIGFEAANEPGLKGMGATVVLALIRPPRALIAHMGDSRAYLLRAGVLEPLTRDHSVVQLLIDAGEITPEEAHRHPARGQITRYVGMAGEPLPEARCLELCPGDRLLLCSDGLTGMVSDAELLALLEEEPEPAAACGKLMAAANEAGGHDNVTALVIAVA